jgi:protein tyrosine/serine phosphatase
MTTHFKSLSKGAARLSLLMLFTTVGALPSAAQFPCAVDFPHDANPTTITDDYICNFHQVDAQLYRGARPESNAYLKLQQLGIRTIIDLEEEDHAEQERNVLAHFNASFRTEDRIDFISFPITQAQIYRTGVSEEQAQRLFHLIQGARKPVFIHCYYGRDRTGAIVALYRMAHEGVPYSQAYAEALHYKFSPEDLGLMRTLDRYKNPKKLASLISP